MKQKTKLEILDETVEFYGADPSTRRARVHLNCRYLTDDGKMCAVGRCCTVPKTNWICKAANLASANNGEVTKLKLEDELKPEYKGHSLDFWSDLQDLHDISRNYTNSGFSSSGLARIEQMKKNINNNRYDS